MKFNLKWTTALLVLLAALLFLPSAWGQVRIKSGASRSGGILHPKELERRIFQLTNEARHKNGLPGLDWDSGLAAKAQAKSDDMLKNNYFSHTSPGRQDPEGPLPGGKAGVHQEHIPDRREYLHGGQTGLFHRH